MPSPAKYLGTCLAALALWMAGCNRILDLNQDFTLATEAQETGDGGSDSGATDGSVPDGGDASMPDGGDAAMPDGGDAATPDGGDAATSDAGDAAP